MKFQKGQFLRYPSILSLILAGPLRTVEIQMGQIKALVVITLEFIGVASGALILDIPSLSAVITSGAISVGKKDTSLVSAEINLSTKVSFQKQFFSSSVNDKGAVRVERTGGN